MANKTKAEKLETVERERERERAVFSKIGFLCVAENKINKYLKRIGYEVGQKRLKEITYPFIC